jgi:hypothetical protein
MRAWEEEQMRRRAEQAQPAPVLPAPAAPAAPTAAAAAPAAPREEAPGYLPIPEFTQPDSTDPAARLEHYSRGIVATQYAARINHERAEQQRLIGLGLRLRAIKEEELHKVAGFDTFGALVYDRFGFKKHQANNIIRVLPVAQVLEDMTTQELKERPLRILVPVLETHGADAVREVWVEARRRGNVTDKTLEEAANFLGYSPPKDATPILEAPPKQDSKALVKPADEPAASAVLNQLRRIAELDPARARREATMLRSGVDQLLASLGEHQSP